MNRGLKLEKSTKFIFGAFSQTRRVVIYERHAKHKKYSLFKIVYY